MVDTYPTINTEKTAPTGLKVISIILYIFAGILILSDLFYFVLIFFNTSLLGSSLSQIISILVLSSPAFFIILGVLYLGLGIFNFFIARGLWRIKDWARALTVVLSIYAFFPACLTLVLLITGPTQPLIGFILTSFALLFSGFSMVYLSFGKSAKDAFMEYREKKVPFAVQLISVLYFVTSILVLISLVILLLASSYLSLLGLKTPFSSLVQEALLAIFLIISLFVARGLWKGKNWARITAIILSFMGGIGVVISGVSSILSASANKLLPFTTLSLVLDIVIILIGLAIELVIGFYLLLNKRVKEAFS